MVSEPVARAIFGLFCGVPLGYVAHQAWSTRRGRKWVIAAVLVLAMFLALAVHSGRLTL